MAPKSQKLWHPIWKHCHPTWKKHFPEDEYEHFMWTDEKLLDFVEEENMAKELSEFYDKVIQETALA